MSITGSLIKISLNIKQCAFRQLLWILQPSKGECGAQNREVTPHWTCMVSVLQSTFHRLIHSGDAFVIRALAYFCFSAHKGVPAPRVRALKQK